MARIKTHVKPGDEVKVIAAGKIYNGFSLVRTLALGADATNCARGMMFALGCIQALKCNTNKCPTGIATQDSALSSSLHVPRSSCSAAVIPQAVQMIAVRVV